MTVKRIFLMFGLILTTLTGLRAQALFPAPSSTKLRPDTSGQPFCPHPEIRMNHTGWK